MVNSQREFVFTVPQTQLIRTFNIVKNIICSIFSKLFSYIGNESIQGRIILAPKSMQVRWY